MISAAINRYVYITLHHTFRKNFLIKYSQMENVDTAADIKHPIIREAFLMHKMEPYMEMVSMADIPAGTGLGPRALSMWVYLRAIYSAKRNRDAGRGRRGLPYRDGSFKTADRQTGSIYRVLRRVDVHGLRQVRQDDRDAAPHFADTLNDLEDNMLMFFTGYSRNASDVLQDQKHARKKKMAR